MNHTRVFHYVIILVPGPRKPTPDKYNVNNIITKTFNGMNINTIFHLIVYVRQKNDRLVIVVNIVVYLIMFVDKRTFKYS